MRSPDENTLVFGAAGDVFPIMTERGSNLAASVRVALVLARQRQVSQIVQSNTTVVRGHEQFVLAWHGLDPGDFPALGVLPPGRPHVNHGVVLELVSAVKDAPSVIGADDGELAILDEVGRGDELGGPVDLVPQGDLLVRDIPQPQFAVEAAREEELIVARMEADCCYEVDVLENAKTFATRDVP